jgi:hypothetical protein
MGPAPNAPAPVPSAPAPQPTSPTTCAGPDPFASLGGGVCQPNGGWVMPNMTCSTPDPFGYFGGGVCINGGWLMRGMGGAPAPAPDASMPLLIVQTFGHEAPPAGAGRQKAELRT